MLYSLILTTIFGVLSYIDKDFKSSDFMLLFFSITLSAYVVCKTFIELETNKD